MTRHLLFTLPFGLLGALILASPAAWAVDRLSFRDTPLLAGASGEEVVALADNDVDLTGFSLAIDYEEARLAVTSVALEETLSEGAELLTVEIDSVRGLIGAGVVFSFAGDRLLAPGEAQPIARLIADVLIAEDSTTVISFEDVLLGGERLVENVFSDAQGFSRLPELTSQTLAIETRAPVILSLTGNRGLAGTEFLIEGEFLDEPELSVTVCGRTAEAVLTSEGSVRVTAPRCGILGFAPLELSTVRGSTAVAEGFFYETPPPPAILELIDNEGRGGDRFTIVGENFHPSGLAVTVCGQPADASLTAEGSLLVTAPSCDAEGFAPVEVCTVSGCALEVDGFLYQTLTPFTRADANGDLRIDIADGIFILLFLFRGSPPGECVDAMDGNDDGRVDIGDPIFLFGFLFRAGSLPPPPFPDAGLDPTPDGLPDC